MITNKCFMNVFLEQEISCQWAMDVQLEAIIRYNAEVRSDQYCCCDGENCFKSMASLLTCPRVYECDVVLIIKLSDCKKCPSVCCFVYVAGSRQNVNINDASLQIVGVPSRLVSS